MPDDKAILEAAKLVPPIPVMMYRAHPIGKAHGDLETWTIDKDLAQSLVDDSPENKLDATQWGVPMRELLSREIDPSKVMIDFGLLSDEQQKDLEIEWDEAVVAKVGILDCDQHYGDGTDDIIDHLAVQDRVEHVSVGRRRNNADQFLSGLDKLVRSFAGCDILLYQAGADPHVDDPLGGWLTTDELRQRDRIVFKAAKAMGLPCCFNLAGGYQRGADGGIRPVLEIHDNTMRECLGLKNRDTGR